VHALACAALRDVELAEAGERDVTPALKGVLDDFQDRIDGLAGFALAQVGPAGHLVDEL
jgi:HEAT repeat protein